VRKGIFNGVEIYFVYYSIIIEFIVILLASKTLEYSWETENTVLRIRIWVYSFSVKFLKVITTKVMAIGITLNCNRKPKINIVFVIKQ